MAFADNQKIEIEYTMSFNYDDIAKNPRTLNDTITTMVCAHNRYSLGDEHGRNPQEVFTIISEKLNMDLGFLVYSREDQDEALKLIREKAYIEPVSLLDHSGVSMSLGERRGWDTGMVGFIFIEKEHFKSEYITEPSLNENSVLSKAVNLFEAEVEEYSEFMEGNVYGFDIKEVIKLAGNEIVVSSESLHGFYGSSPVKNGMIDAICQCMEGDFEENKNLLSTTLKKNISGEDFEIVSKEILFGELSDSVKEKLRNEYENIGLKVFVGEDGQNHIKIDGVVINDKTFTEAPMPWTPVVVKTEDIASLPEYHDELAGVKEDYVFLAPDEDGGAKRLFSMQSDPDEFRLLCDAILAISSIKDMLDKNRDRRANNNTKLDCNSANVNP